MQFTRGKEKPVKSRTSGPGRLSQKKTAGSDANEPFLREATSSASHMPHWDTLQTDREPEPWPELPASHKQNSPPPPPPAPRVMCAHENVET